MGDIADMMVDGTLDSSTGEYLGPGPGYPRSLDPQSPDYIHRKRDRDPNRKMNPQFGVENYLKNGGNTDFAQITDDYFVHLRKVESDHNKRCEFISNDFGAFIKWFKKRNSKTKR